MTAFGPWEKPGPGLANGTPNFWSHGIQGLVQVAPSPIKYLLIRNSSEHLFFFLEGKIKTFAPIGYSGRS